MNLSYLFAQDHVHHEGVRSVNIYLLRVLYLLIAFFVGQTAWAYLFEARGEIPAMEGIVWCVWASFSLVCVIGIFKPLKMLPIVILEIFYKLIWLAFVAYPAWAAKTLNGTEVEEMLPLFLWVVLPICAVPWSYVFKSYVFTFKTDNPKAVR